MNASSLGPCGGASAAHAYPGFEVGLWPFARRHRPLGPLYSGSGAATWAAQAHLRQPIVLAPKTAAGPLPWRARPGDRVAADAGAGKHRKATIQIYSIARLSMRRFHLILT